MHHVRYAVGACKLLRARRQAVLSFRLSRGSSTSVDFLSHFLTLTTCFCRILLPDATNARLPSLKSGSSVSMTLPLGSGRTTNPTFSALNAATRFSRPRAPILKREKSGAGSWPCLATASSSRIMWALRCTAVIRTASRAMCDCGCPSVSGVRRVSEMETAPLRRWVASGVGHVSFARYERALSQVFPRS